MNWSEERVKRGVGAERFLIAAERWERGMKEVAKTFWRKMRKRRVREEVADQRATMINWRRKKLRRTRWDRKRGKRGKLFSKREGQAIVKREGKGRLVTVPPIVRPGC